MMMPITGDLAGKRVRVVVAVLVDAEARGGSRAEQTHIFGMPRNRTGPALAADMPVEANHAVTCAKHHMQIVGDEEDAAAAAVADRRDQLIKVRSPGKVHRLRRFVEHQQLRITGERAGKQNALKLAAGQLAHLRVDQALRSRLRQASGRARL